jgi:hypothetical protein
VPDVVRTPPIDYSSRDYVAIKSDLVSLVQFFTPEWTDWNESDPGIVILSLLAAMGDALHYYVDRMAAESFLDTAITPEAVVALARQIDYTPSGPAPAIVTLTIAVPASATVSEDYVIPAGTRVTTGTVEFETDEDLTIPAGQRSGDVTATQGKTIGSVPPDGEESGTADGLPFQTFSLSQVPAVAASVRVFIDEAAAGDFREWGRVESFVDESATARIFVLSRRSDGVVLVHFGDGTTGRIPPTGAPIQVAYRIGGGESGNVGAGTIETFLSSLPGGVSATVTNAEAAEGGSSGQSLAQVKRAAPRALRSLHRAVTLEDYENLALSISGVQAASAAWYGAEQQVRVAVAGADGIATSTLKAEVQALLEDRTAQGMSVLVVDPTLVEIDISGTVVVEPEASRTAVQALIDDALVEFFTIGTEDGQSNFGEDVHESDIVALIDGIEGVDHFDLTRLSRSPTIDLTNLAAKATEVVGSVGADNDTEQTLTLTLAIDFVLGDDVSYDVSGTRSGTIATPGTAVFDDGTGDNGEPFVLQEEDVDVSLTVLFPTLAAIQAGTAIAPQPGDTIVVKVGKFRGNQTLSADEIRRQGTVALTITGGVA